LANTCGKERQKLILSEYRKLRADRYTHSQAVGQLSQDLNHTPKTISSAIDRELQAEEYELRLIVVEKAKTKQGMDWETLIPVAIANFMGALYGFEELTASQTWATKEIIKKVEESKKTTGEKPPESAFDHD
jgi:hypothetical protein